MSIIQFVLVTIIIEIFDAFLNYSKTLKQSTLKIYNNYYSKGIFYFFAIQLGYIWIVFVALSINKISWIIIFALTLKIFDIFAKLDLIDKIIINPTSALHNVIDMPIPKWVYLTGILTYPYLVFLALK